MIGLALLTASLFLLVYPFAIYPLILRLLPERPVLRAPPGTPPPSASLLFCAYNEREAMPDKIANLRALKARYPDLEILAYDDGSNDGTGAMLAAAADIVTVVNGPGRTGKAHGMKILAAMATGDILIFTDANVRVEEDAIERLLGYYADAKVGGVLGSLHYEASRVSASALVGGLYWRIEEALKDRESRTGNVMGADGSIFSVRRALYPDFPDNVLDDLYVSMSIVFRGYRLIKARDVVAWEGLVAERSEEMNRKVRIACRSWITHRAMRPQLYRMALIDRFKYASRKLVRWFGAVWMVTAAAGLLLAFDGIGAQWAWALLGLAAVLMLFGYIARSGPLAALVDITFAYFSTLRGILLAMRGRDFTVWSPAKSRL